MNLSNETSPPVVDLSCSINHLSSIINSYIIPAISVVGVVTNTWCIYAFVRILRNSRASIASNMFKYLLLKSIQDDCQFLVQVFAPLYYCVTCSTYQTFSSQVWYIGFYYYVEATNELASGLYDLAATFDCLLAIGNQCRVFQSTFMFYTLSTVIFLFSALFYIFFLFDFRISPVIDITNNQTSYFIVEYTEFSSTQISKSFNIAHGVLRDIVVMFLIILLNIFILIRMKNIVKKKTQMTQARTTGESGERLKRPVSVQARRAEKNIRYMILAIGINYVIGHVMSFIKYCFIRTPSSFRTCFTNISELLFYTSYATPFFIYMSFNRTFRANALGKRGGDASSLEPASKRPALTSHK